MSLTHEATQFFPGYKYGDIKVAHYAITYSANAITVPANDPAWMLLNGAVLAQATYPILFSFFGSTYNTGGEGAGNFRIPDLTEGRTPLASGLTSFPTPGASGGEINHILTSSEMPSHSHGNTFAWAGVSHGHTVSATINNSTDAHTHSMISAVFAATTRGFGGSGTAKADSGLSTGTSGGASANHSHTGAFNPNANTSGVTLNGGILNAGSASSHNNMQPYIVVGGWLVRYG